MKNILVTQRVEYIENYGELRTSIDIEWSNLLLNQDLTPILVPSSNTLEKIVKSTNISGVLLTGGNNLSSLSDNKADYIRDEIDGSVLNYALDNDLPVIAVCRGAQFLAEKFGFTISPTTGHVGKNHKIEWINNLDLLDNLNYPDEVNSYHNYKISGASKECIINALSTDGGIEAFSHKDKQIIGIMWHPERMKVLENFEKQVFSIF